MTSARIVTPGQARAMIPTAMASTPRRISEVAVDLITTGMPFRELSGAQLVARAAARMTRVTVPGSEISDRCEAFTLVMCAPARWAMNSCSAGGMTWSAVPITSQDEIVCQAGTPEGADPALSAMGLWVAARTAAWLAGRSLAKHWANPG